MNIPHYTTHTHIVSTRFIRKAIKTINSSFLELLQLPITDLVNVATDNTSVTALLLDKITLIRQLNSKITSENVKSHKNINIRYEKALNLRLRTLVSLFNPEQSCKFSLKINQDELFLSNIANKILNDKNSALIHHLSMLTSIVYTNKLNADDFVFGCKTKLQALEDSFITKIYTIIHTNVYLDLYHLTYCLSLFSVYYGQYKSKLSNNNGELPLFSPYLSIFKQNKQLSLITDELSSENANFDNPVNLNGHRPNIDIIHSILEKISDKLLSSDNLSAEIISLSLESIANIYTIDNKGLSNVNNLLQKLLHTPIERYLISNYDRLSDININTGIQNPSILSQSLYGIYMTGNFNSPLFNQIVNSLTEDILKKVKFNNPIELFRTSFSLIVSNQISKGYISKWLLKEIVRLSSEAVKYPSQFLFLLTGLSLSPNLSLMESERNIGSSISFDKSIYERAEAELKLLETGELSFTSDILSMKHLFSLAESLIPTLNNSEFVQILHSFCSTKLHHPRLVKIKLYSEGLKRLPMLPVEAIPQLLRSSIWLLSAKSDDTMRLAYAVTDRLLGELVKGCISSFVISESLVLLDKCSIYSKELAIVACIAFSRRNYQDLDDLNFNFTAKLLHYLSSSSITPSIKTSGELKETELEITRDFLFNKSIYIIKQCLLKYNNNNLINTNDNNVITDYGTVDNKIFNPNITGDITLDSVTSILHSAHIKGEVTRFAELTILSVNLVNSNVVTGATGDSLRGYTKVLSAMCGREYKFKINDGIYDVFQCEN